jgi:hypothetical protein
VKEKPTAIVKDLLTPKDLVTDSQKQMVITMTTAKATEIAKLTAKATR